MITVRCYEAEPLTLTYACRSSPIFLLLTVRHTNDQLHLKIDNLKLIKNCLSATDPLDNVSKYTIGTNKFCFVPIHHFT